MGKEVEAKVFKSGNSLALRLPKALGLKEGEEMVVLPHEDGSLSMWRKADAKAVFMSLAGSMSPGFMAEGRGDIEQEDRDWGRETPTTKVA